LRAGREAARSAFGGFALDLLFELDAFDSFLGGGSGWLADGDATGADSGIDPMVMAPQRRKKTEAAKIAGRMTFLMPLPPCSSGPMPLTCLFTSELPLFQGTSGSVCGSQLCLYLDIWK
jgi:hypothetical protein